MGSMSNAHITVKQNGNVVWEGYTDEDGKTTGAILDAGTYDVTIEKVGYSTLITQITLTKSGAVFAALEVDCEGNFDIWTQKWIKNAEDDWGAVGFDVGPKIRPNEVVDSLLIIDTYMPQVLKVKISDGTLIGLIDYQHDVIGGNLGASSEELTLTKYAVVIQKNGSSGHLELSIYKNLIVKQTIDLTTNYGWLYNDRYSQTVSIDSTGKYILINNKNNDGHRYEVILFEASGTPAGTPEPEVEPEFSSWTEKWAITDSTWNVLITALIVNESTDRLYLWDDYHFVFMTVKLSDGTIISEEEMEVTMWGNTQVLSTTGKYAVTVIKTGGTTYLKIFKNAVLIQTIDLTSYSPTSDVCLAISRSGKYILLNSGGNTTVLFEGS